MSEQRTLLAYFPSEEISIYQSGEEMDIDHPDVVDRRVAEEAGAFVIHLLTKEAESFEKMREAGDWEKLDAAFAAWRRARGV
ncbi:MAG TPA: hypothetical protein VNE39_24610 [Planctomycetota bacterium]|nr:hypothetical protein [Planctomycetota bacterium]